MNNWASESDGVLGDHNSDSLVTAVTASESWSHETLVHSAALLQDKHTLGNIDLGVAARWVVNDHHQWNALRMVLTHKSGCLFGIITVKLNQMSLLSQHTLHGVVLILSHILDSKPVLLILLVVSHFIFICIFK